MGVVALVCLQFVVLGLSFLIPNYSQLVMGTGETEAGSFLPAAIKADGNAVINTLQQLAGAIGTSVVTAVVNAAQVGATARPARAA